MFKTPEEKIAFFEEYKRKYDQYVEAAKQFKEIDSRVTGMCHYDKVAAILSAINESPNFKDSLKEFEKISVTPTNDGLLYGTPGGTQNQVYKLDDSWKTFTSSQFLSDAVKNRRLIGLEIGGKFICGDGIDDTFRELMSIVLEHFQVEDFKDASGNWVFPWFRNTCEFAVLVGNFRNFPVYEVGNNAQRFENYIKVFRHLGLDELIDKITVYYSAGKSNSK